MRTTLELPDVLAKQAKTAAIRRGITLKTLVTEALEQALNAGFAKPTGRPIRFPLVGSRKPGAMRLNPNELHAILLREEAAANGRS